MSYVSLASECAPPPGTKGGGGALSPVGEGLGESQFRRLEKSLALCLLCGFALLFMSSDKKLGDRGVREGGSVTAFVCEHHYSTINSHPLEIFK